MSTTIKTGWLKDNGGEKFAPKTTTNQVLTGDGERLTDKLAEMEAKSAKHADRTTSNTFTGEQRMNFPGYCNTVHDIASGIGCSLKNSRALDNQMIVGEVYAPYTSATDEAMGMHVVKDEIPFYAIDSTEKPEGSGSQKLNKTLLGKITRNGFEGNATTANSAIKATQDSNGKVIADTYETKSEANVHKVDTSVHITPSDRSNIEYAANSVSNILSGNISVSKAVSADNATNATSAANAVKASADILGNPIISTYETKTDANNKFTDAKSYTDTLYKKQLQGIFGGSSGTDENKIWHICKWEAEASWEGVGVNYSVVDNETTFNGILGIKFRNQNTINDSAASVQWLAASRDNSNENNRIPKAVLTKEIIEATDTTSATAIYHLYIYVNKWYSPAITKLHETVAGSVNYTEINEYVTELVGTELASSDAVKVPHATYATKAGLAVNDEVGNNLIGTYETKTDSANKLTQAKSFATTEANRVKNELLNGAGSAYDTLSELADLIIDNKDTIQALEKIATSKADANHVHKHIEIDGLEDTYETKTDANNKLSLLSEQVFNLADGLNTGTIEPLYAISALRDRDGNIITSTYETKNDATSKHAELNTKVEKITPFTATYNQTSLAELQNAKTAGKPIQLKTIDTEIIPGTYDSSGNLIMTWDELMLDWQSRMTDMGYPDFIADVSRDDLVPPMSVFSYTDEPYKLVIPEYINKIGNYAFYPSGFSNTYELTEVVFLGTPTKIGDLLSDEFGTYDYTVFTSTVTKIYVPFDEGVVVGAPWQGTYPTANVFYNNTNNADITTTYVNQLISVKDNQFIFRGHNDKGDIEYVCNQNGWSTRNIQVIKLGDAMFKYDYENKRIVLSFSGEGVE